MKSLVYWTVLGPGTIQFISLSIDLLQGVNHKDVENSHRIHQNIQSSSIQLDTVCQWIYTFIQKGTLQINNIVPNDNVHYYTFVVSKNI